MIKVKSTLIITTFALFILLATSQGAFAREKGQDIKIDKVQDKIEEKIEKRLGKFIELYTSPSNTPASTSTPTTTPSISPTPSPTTPATSTPTTTPSVSPTPTPTATTAPVVVATTTPSKSPVAGTTTPVLGNSASAGNTTLGNNVFTSGYYGSTAFGRGMTLALGSFALIAALAGAFLVSNRGLTAKPL